MDLSQFDAFFDDDELKLPPIKSTKYPAGKRYTIPSPDFETGALLQKLANIAQRIQAGVPVSEAEAKSLKFDDDQEVDLAVMLLGATLEEMKSDGVGWGPIRRATQYAFTHYAISPQAAERLATPKAPTPTNRAAKRAKKKK